MSGFANYDGGVLPPLGGLLQEKSAMYGGNTAVILDDDHLSYKELHDRALEVARGLSALGVKPGDRVGILMPNCIELIIVFFATQMIGAVAITINARYKSYELSRTIDSSDIKLLLVTDKAHQYVDFLELLFDSFPDLARFKDRESLQLDAAPSLKSIVVYGSSDKGPFIPIDNLISRGASPGATIDEDNGEVDDIALSLFTSGTTAAPKQCQLTHRNIYQSWALAYPKIVSLAEGETIWCPMPLFHIGGIGLMLAAITHGASFVSSIYYEPSAALRVMREYRPEHLYPGFFTLLLPMLREPDYRKSDFDCVRTIQMVAPYETRLQIKQMLPAGIVINNTIGLTEAAGLVTCTTGEMTEKDRLESCGPPIKDCEVRIAREEDNVEVPVGSEGEIQFRGPNAFHSYNKDEAATKRTKLEDGWVKTGDCGQMDEKGLVYFIGRMKDMLKVGGENVAAAEIEAYLGRHPAVNLAQVIGKKDDYYGEVPVAFVELREGKTIDPAELIDFCKGKIASYKVPREVHFITEWPMSATKIQKFKLHELISNAE